MLQHTIRFLLLRLVKLFYPHIEVDGAENLPNGGPIMFVANHPNGLLDPMVLMIGLRRHISFLAKSTFFANPIGRTMMQAFGALPVYRQRDEGLAGGAAGDRADRNEQTFARCRALLRSGQPMALFPEGTTHSNP
ncbi:MAG TPA: 1-acyl-sn-glycerol-3-phosphate acyltransferase, partial [Roseiflexaceae bacterium]|nr:1-acyl-sn-glycerol-3-phosphate acyltransferase [Roseiflexaceae bacterium]